MWEFLLVLIAFILLIGGELSVFEIIAAILVIALIVEAIKWLKRH